MKKIKKQIHSQDTMEGDVSGYIYNRETGKYDIYVNRGHSQCRVVLSVASEDEAIGKLCELMEKEYQNG